MGLPALRSRFAECVDLRTSHDRFGAARQITLVRGEASPAVDHDRRRTSESAATGARRQGHVLGRAPGNAIDIDKLVEWLEINGFTRNATVRDTGDYAVRGGIVDLFAPALAEPIRLDFFGDTLESIRSFDPERSAAPANLKHSTLCR